jgi:hypothetical protein
VLLVDVRFGGLNGRQQQEENFVFGYRIYEEDGTIVV